MKNIQRTGIPVTKEAAAGAAVYTKFTLFFYDALVMVFENHFVWKCSTRKIINFYNHHISGKHLDVGVGTGYFLDNCAFPADKPVIHLMDLNRNSLEKTSKRIKRYNPVVHQWNILEPITIKLPKFNSICVSNILHCLPGNIYDKEIVLKNLKRFLNNDGTLFGLTILGRDVKVGILYKLFNSLYNRRKIFSNSNDSLAALDEILKSNFSKYTLDLEGSVALFSCRP
jgi:ubiquinone/menaquinone biosynthesis C-methylase UbiE